MTRHIARMTWTQVALVLKQDPMMLIPLGALEPHGPHLPMGLDFLVAEHFAEAAAERTGALVAPTLPHGYCPSTADFPGAITLRGETLIGLLEDTLMSLARHGARHLLFVDNHRGNNPFVEVAARRVRAATGALVGSFFPWGTIINHSPDFYADFAAVFGHGGEPETSTTLYLFPDLADMTQARRESYTPFHGLPVKSAMEPGIGKAIASLWINNSEISTTNAKGDPTIADPDRGRRLVEAAVDDLVRVIEAFRRLPAGVPA